MDLYKAMCTNGFKSYPQIYSHATRQLYFWKMLIKKYLNNIQIELYTNKKDLQEEAKLEDILDSHEITYQTSETFIESEGIFQKIYEMRMI